VTATASFDRRPAVPSSALAVAFGVVAVAFVADTGAQREVLTVAVVGSVTFAAGVVAWRRGHAAIGELAVAGGTVVVLVSVWYGLTRPMLSVHRFELIPGLVGVWLLAAGVAPLRYGWERRLLAAGTGLVFVSVVMSGVVQATDLGPLLVAGLLTIVAWDVGENAVSLGRQVGVDGDTRRAEAVHLATTALVGGAAVLLVLVVAYLGVDGLPFAALATLLLAGVVLAVSHYR